MIELYKITENEKITATQLYEKNKETLIKNGTFLAEGTLIFKLNNDNLSYKAVVANNGIVIVKKGYLTEVEKLIKIYSNMVLKG